MGIVSIYGHARSSTNSSNALLSGIMRLDGYARRGTDAKNTDVISFINDDFIAPMMSLLPRGRMWPRETDTVLYALMKALSHSGTVVMRRARELIEEMDPQTTTELLADWERVTAIADDCGIADTLAERRTAVVEKLGRNTSPNSPEFLAIAAALNYPDATIKTYSPFTPGSTPGDHVYDSSWRFRFDVVRFTGPRDTELACQVDALAPLHTTNGQIPSYNEWIARTTGVTKDLYAVGKAGGLWVLAGQSGTILTSDNLIDWVARGAGVGYTGIFSDIIQSGTNAVLVGGGEIQTSPDAITWTSRVTGAADVFRSIASNGSRLVTVGFTQSVRTSDDDGSTWIARSFAGGGANFYQSVAYGGGQFVAVASAGEVQYSADGIIWARATPLSAAGNIGVVYFGGRFVVVADDGGTYYSDDLGVTWAAGRPVGGVLGSSQPERIAVSPSDGVLHMGTDLATLQRWMTLIDPSKTQAVGWEAGGWTSGGKKIYGVGVAENTALFVGETGILYTSERDHL